MLTRKTLRFAPTGFLSVMAIVMAVFLVAGTAAADRLPTIDKSVYHTWEEVDAYLKAVARCDELDDIVKLIPIGYTREGRPLRVLQSPTRRYPVSRPTRNQRPSSWAPTMPVSTSPKRPSSP